MLKHRFVPYIVAIGIVAFFSLSYVGYKTYQNHVEFERFISDVQAFNRSVEGQHDHSSHDHTHHGEGLSVTSKPDQIGEAGTVSGHEHEHHQTPPGEYVYMTNGVPHYSNVPLSQEHLELIEWRKTGKTTPYMEGYLKSLAENSSHKYQVVQRVVTPDGQIHQVIVPRDHQYEEGDAILRSELDPQMLAMSEQRNWEMSMEVNGVAYSMPEEYYSIEDPYEREEYMAKFTWSVRYSISMAEVEKKVAAGELNVSLSEAQKRFVDQREAERERTLMLNTGFTRPPPSEKSPVKVSFLPDDSEGEVPGWMQKRDTNAWRSILADMEGYGGGIVDEEGIKKDASSPPIRFDVSRSISGQVRSMPSRQNEVGPETSKKTAPPTVESLETPGLSAARRAQAEWLLNQYGMEEGLLRLREFDPEAARQFERERGRPSSWRQTKGTDISPSNQQEKNNKVNIDER